MRVRCCGEPFSLAAASCACCNFFFSSSFLGVSPPYFSISLSVESYLVASLSFWIVFSRSAVWSFNLVDRLSIRKE